MQEMNCAFFIYRQNSVDLAFSGGTTPDWTWKGPAIWYTLQYMEHVFACMKTWRHWNHTVSHILYNILLAHFKVNGIAGQIDINRMNWTTKAKTRAGRGKSKADIENQQRLTARNKLPKGNSTSEAVRALTADKVITLSSLFRPFSDRSSELSNDLMMLQSSTDSFVSQKLRPSQSQPPLSRRPPKAVNINDMEDPLLLLEYTVIS
jgi:hypothetical protein